LFILFPFLVSGLNGSKRVFEFVGDFSQRGSIRFNHQEQKFHFLDGIDRLAQIVDRFIDRPVSGNVGQDMPGGRLSDIGQPFSC